MTFVCLQMRFLFLVVLCCRWISCLSELWRLPACSEWLVACAGFEAEAEDELSVVPGDEVTVHVEIEGWVQVTRARDGQKGLVPASYLSTL